MIEFSYRPFHEVASEIVPHIPAHGAEAEGGVNVDWDYYLEASYLGQCMAVTAHQDGELAGYSIFFISKNANQKHMTEASNVALYVTPKHRGKLALLLMKKSDEFLNGVDEITYTLRDDRIGKLLSRQGYKPEYKVWSIKHG